MNRPLTPQRLRRRSTIAAVVATTAAGALTVGLVAGVSNPAIASKTSTGNTSTGTSDSSTGASTNTSTSNSSSSATSNSGSGLGNANQSAQPQGGSNGS